MPAKRVVVPLRKVPTGFKKRLCISRKEIRLDIFEKIRWSGKYGWSWYKSVCWDDEDFLKVAQAIFELLDKEEREKISK